MQAAVRSTYTPQVLTDVGSFGGLFALARADAAAPACGFHRRCRHQGQAGRPAQPLAGHRPSTSSTTASTTSWCRARDRFSSSTISPPTSSCRRMWPPSYSVWRRPAAPPAARSSAAKRPKCRASTRPGSCDVAGTIVGLVDRLSPPAPHDTPSNRAICCLVCPAAAPTQTVILSFAASVAARDPQQPLEDGEAADRRAACSSPLLSVCGPHP